MAGNIRKGAPEVRPGRSIFRTGESQIRPERSRAQVRGDKKKDVDCKNLAKHSAHIVTMLGSHPKPNVDFEGKVFLEAASSGRQAFAFYCNCANSLL
jgi:hypothetical protein